MKCLILIKKVGLQLKATRPFTNTTKHIVVMLFIAFLTAVSSEIKIMPFDHATFRFGLGSVVFFLALLVRSVPIIPTGILTAIIVIIWRTVLNIGQGEHTTITTLIDHVPAALFYIVFAIGLQLVPLEHIKKRPLLLGIYGMLFDVIANMSEQIAVGILVVAQVTMQSSILLFLLVGFLRSLFVVGLFSALTLSEHKKQLRQLMLIHSNLYVEALYMQKSIHQVEQLTATSFQLYKKLKAFNPSLSKEALLISQEIHEVKKDQVRIYTGLAKVTNTQYKKAYFLSDLLTFIVEANQNYAHFLHKSVQFKILCPRDFKTQEHIALLAILNNLVANAIEAINEHGTITLTVKVDLNTTEFIVEDDGMGIAPQVLAFIFDAGYTTKFNTSGYASTGIGLSHTKTIIENLQGSVHVTSGHLTRFTVRIPTSLLCKEGT